MNYIAALTEILKQSDTSCSPAQDSANPANRSSSICESAADKTNIDPLSGVDLISASDLEQLLSSVCDSESPAPEASSIPSSPSPTDTDSLGSFASCVDWEYSPSDSLGVSDTLDFILDSDEGVVL